MTRPISHGKAAPEPGVADAAADNWVDRHAPRWMLPYLRLARVDRPIGFWLLAIPCFWAIALAGRSGGAEFPDLRTLILFALGALVMRGAGCVYNDIVDRDIDKAVARTKARPLASGQIGVAAAIVFMICLCLVGLAVLLSFNALTVGLGVLVLPIVAVYPFVKRVSYWPQLVLGLAFSWGALMGYTAVQGDIQWAPILLYVGSVAWAIGYDTIYSHQDREDDALLGVKSTALRFGAATRLWVAGFYAFAWVCITLAGLAGRVETLFMLGMVAAGAHLFWQVATLDIDDPENCLTRFRSNRDFGAIVFAAIVLDMYLAANF
jgi:4-hydroxybenzoate polyprenyltransferase